MSTSQPRRLANALPDSLFTNRSVVFVESIVALVLVWSVVYRILPPIQESFVSPTEVVIATQELLVSMVWVEHFLASLTHVAYGFGIALFAGTALGILVGWWDFWEKAFQDYLTIGIAVPSLFVAIFSAMWFGLGATTPAAAAAIVATPYLATNVYGGINNIDNDLLKMSNAFDVSRFRVIRRVIIQSVLPDWFAGLRYALALSWKIASLAEYIAAEQGIGFMIRFEMRVLDLAGVMSWVVFFTVFLLFLEYGVLAQIEKRVFAWRQNDSVGWS
ncbi:ABC transporter permease [Haloparvum sedimenti]|uniref:ABC transporter permease n=1 Tax=Haloparvum sedimenti TaxID=1678448 RepID=UPI00071E8B02|nr:ABC transporter permease subunit [Haloparvum sedimenti]